MLEEQETKHVHFTVEEPLETEERELTVREILTRAGEDPETHYLVEIDGCEQKKFADLNERVQIREGAKFIAVFTGPTPTS